MFSDWTRGYVVGQDVFNGSGNSARLPFSGSLTLPFTGKYVIEATSNGLQQTGNYALNIALEGCVLTINPTSQHFGSNGGTGTINVTATGSNCAAGYQLTVWPNPSPWLLPKTLNGAGTQVLEFTVDPNSKVAGRRAFLVIGASWWTDGWLVNPHNAVRIRSGLPADSDCVWRNDQRRVEQH